MRGRDFDGLQGSVETFVFSFRDVSLDRLKMILNSYCCLYDNVTFVIRRKPDCYQMDLRGRCL